MVGRDDDPVRYPGSGKEPLDGGERLVLATEDLFHLAFSGMTFSGSHCLFLEGTRASVSTWCNSQNKTSRYIPWWTRETVNR